MKNCVDLEAAIHLNQHNSNSHHTHFSCYDLTTVELNGGCGTWGNGLNGEPRLAHKQR